MPLDPTKPFAIRTLVAAVKAGQTLVIFPEGRLTVTGSLMKIYDGAGLIADKTAATIVPVRIEGPESTIFSRLTPQQARRRWFPKFTLTALEPTHLSIHNELKGRKRREAAGAHCLLVPAGGLRRHARAARYAGGARAPAAGCARWSLR